MKLILLLFSVFLYCLPVDAQDERQVVSAVRVDHAPKIDGVLDDSQWLNVPVAKDFRTIEPGSNLLPTQKTEVKIVYDNMAVYIAAMMYDSAPDSILHVLTKRDEENGNADKFYVGFDTYYDRQNAYIFGVTAAGVQNDLKMGTDNFDAVWESAVKINEKGWIAEIRIPYSAIRFPKKEGQKWGLQFLRHIRRTRETSVWQFVSNDIQNPVAFWGTLEGLSNIIPPLRLSLTPYLGTTISHFPFNQSGKSNFSTSYNFGADLKYGINESFTLDMTLAPDFSQVQSDNQVLNISPFEVEFEENRPFFKEGTELFDIGGIFYPRRIGRSPSGFEYIQYGQSLKVIENPAQAQLFNATKLSGRTPDGLGIGVLNAVTGEMNAVVEDSAGKRTDILTEPLTNYNVLVANQTLENNSSISVINTNVTRQGAAGGKTITGWLGQEAIYNANTTAFDFSIANKENKYAAKGTAAISQKLYSTRIDDGYKYNLSFSKISGNFQFALGRNVESDTYDPNDLGLLFSPDEITNYLEVTLNRYEPKGITLRRFTTATIEHSTTYRTRQFQKMEIEGSNFTVFKNYLAWFAYFNITPLRTNDFYEARVPGRIYKGPAYAGAVTGVSTDYRKPVAVDVSIGYFRDLHFVDNGIYREAAVKPTIRVNDRLSFNHQLKYSQDDGRGFAATENNDSLIYFGIRSVKTFNNIFTAQYIFTPNMSFSFRTRHYWSTVEIAKFKLLEKNGELRDDDTHYNENKNRSQNYFNIDLVYQWRFAPGSDLIFVWKNSISPDDNYIPATSRELQAGYGLDLYRTLLTDQTNSFSVKVLYYLDYQYLKGKGRA